MAKRHVKNASKFSTEKLVIHVLQLIFMMVGILLGLIYLCFNNIGGLLILLSAVVVSPLANVVPVMKRNLIGKAIMQFLCAFIIFVSGFLMVPVSLMDSSEETVSTEIVPIEISANDFASKFSDDKYKAKKECEGNIYVITGEYKKTHLSSVELKTDIMCDKNSEYSIKFKFEDKQDMEFMNDIREGTQIVLRGEFSSIIYDSIEFKKAEFIEEVHGNDLEILTIEGHPTFYGSTQLAHDVWDKVPGDDVLIKTGITHHHSNADYVLILDCYEGGGIYSYTDSDIIRGIHVNFDKSYSSRVAFEDVFSIIRDYLPMDIFSEWYEFNKSYYNFFEYDGKRTHEHIIVYSFNQAGINASQNGEISYSDYITIGVHSDDEKNVISFFIYESSQSETSFKPQYTEWGYDIFQEAPATFTPDVSSDEELATSETELLQDPVSAPSIEYWINTDSGKIHYADCSTIKDKTEPHWQTSTASKDDLIAQGYSPCGVCMK